MKQTRLLCLAFLTAFCMGIGGVNHSLYAQYPRYQAITTFVGNGEISFSNGFKTIDADAAGNLYIADASSQFVVKFNPSDGTRSVIAGTGVPGYNGDNIPATNASLYYPSGIVVDPSGNIYISDRINFRVRKVNAATGIITTIAGNGTSSYAGDGGLATAASLSWPGSLAIDVSGNLYIADNSKVRKISATTGVITNVAGTDVSGFGGDGGPATSANFYFISDVKVDPAGNLFVADHDNYRIRKVNAATGIISTVVGDGSSVYSGEGGLATLAGGTYSCLDLDASGNLYISDNDNFVVRKVTAGTNIISRIAGTGALGWAGDGGPAVNASLAFPFGLVVDPSGNIEFTQNQDQVVRKINLGTGVISVVVAESNIGDGGTSLNAIINDPRDVAVDASGNVYIVDGMQNRVRKVNASTNIISTVAGNGMAEFSGDGGPATSASLNYPSGIALDAAGNLYIADMVNNRIRKVNAATGIITTVAGDGSPGISGMAGPAVSASFELPTDIAFDAAGNMYFDASHSIFKVNAATNIISMVAGTGLAGYSGDGGPAVNAQFWHPHGIVFDPSGNLIVCDKVNNRVRKIDMNTGIISTIAGTGVPGISGDGGPATSAQLNEPDDLAFDPDGHLLITDYQNHRVRLLDFTNGNLYSVAGSGTPGFSGDGGPSILAELNFPDGLAIASNGRAYVSDETNHRIRTFPALSTTLPITLMNFDAHKEGNNVQLEWTTASETNTRSFVIERSSNDFDKWLAIDTLTAAGNSVTNRSYTTTDRHVLNGTNYYRLKQIDLDGKFTYSKVVSIFLGQTSEVAISAYPNPFTNNLKINLYSKETIPVNLQVVTVAGQIVREKTINLYKGENTLNLDNLHDLKPGLYIIQLKKDDINIAIRLIKQ